jgi:hypothetical protein
VITVEEFRAEVRGWLADNLVGDFAALKGLGGPGREHEAFEERLAWNQHLAAAGRAIGAQSGVVELSRCASLQFH